MANNTNYKPNEGKREEFRRYLEKTGVMDALTKVLVLLYEEAEKPDDALKFILNALSRQVGGESIDDLKAQVVSLQEKLGALEGQVGGGSSAHDSATAAAGGSVTAQARVSSTAEAQGAGADEQAGFGSSQASNEQQLEGAEEAQEKHESAATLEEGDA